MMVVKLITVHAPRLARSDPRRDTARRSARSPPRNAHWRLPWLSRHPLLPYLARTGRPFLLLPPNRQRLPHLLPLHPTHLDSPPRPLRRGTSLRQRIQLKTWRYGLWDCGVAGHGDQFAGRARGQGGSAPRAREWGGAGRAWGGERRCGRNLGRIALRLGGKDGRCVAIRGSVGCVTSGRDVTESERGAEGGAGPRTHACTHVAILGNAI